MSNASTTPEFRKVLQGLYSAYPHWKSGDVLREAWKEYKERHGKLGPSGTTQRKRYAMRKTAAGMNPRKKKPRRSCPGCGGLISGKVCLTCLKNPRRKKQRKNPIAVYNPRVRLIKLPTSQVEIRYKRTGGEYAGKWFKHEFKSSIGIYGMSDGSVLLKSLSGKKLWGTVD